MPPATNSPSEPAPSLTQNIQKFVMSLQFLWFLGHLITLISGATFIILFRFYSNINFSYYIAYYGAVLSYSVILYSSHGVPVISRAYLQRIYMNENTHYLMLALIWLSFKPLWVTLLPYVSFSLFHTLTFTRGEIIPNFLPPTTFPLAKKISDQMEKLINVLQIRALYFVAYIEVYLILPMLIISSFIGYFGLISSVLLPLMFAQFMRSRYFFSPMTKHAFWDLKKRGDLYIGDNNRVPVAVRNAYLFVREFIAKLGDVESEIFRKHQAQTQK